MASPAPPPALADADFVLSANFLTCRKQASVLLDQAHREVELVGFCLVGDEPGSVDLVALALKNDAAVCVPLDFNKFDASYRGNGNGCILKIPHKLQIVVPADSEKMGINPVRLASFIAQVTKARNAPADLRDLPRRLEVEQWHR